MELTKTTVSQRVAAILSDRIRTGHYTAGDRLPTERLLALEFRVHRRAVRAAVEMLVEEGLVSHSPNCRPLVLSGSKSAIRTIIPKSGSRLSASNLIALIMWRGGGPLENSGTAQQRIFWGMNQTLGPQGYHAVFLDVGRQENANSAVDNPLKYRGGQLGSDEDNAKQEAGHLLYAAENKFGGVVFYPYAYAYNADLIRQLSPAMPIVMLDRRVDGVDGDFVGIRNRDSMFEATTHLLSLGHRRIAHVTNTEPIHVIHDRLHGFVEAMHAFKATGISETILMLPTYEDERRWTIFDAVFGLPPSLRPTALTCLSDYGALDAAERLSQHGLAVPDDVAMTGFDNVIPFLPNGMGLTTMAQPYEEMGAAAANLILRRLADPSSDRVSFEIPAKLVVRGTSGQTL